MGWYDADVKTVLIAESHVPDELRDVLAQGSTSLEERAAGSGDAPAGADRIVFFAAAADRAVREDAGRLAGAARDRREDTFVYVTTADGPAPDGLGAHEVYRWPADEDRLRMAFLTSA